MQALDTSALPRRERADAIVTHLREIALASKVVLQDPDRAFMSTRVYQLGDVQLVHLRRSGLFIEVTRERDDTAPTIAMMLGSRAQATREQFGHTIEQRAGVVDMVELNQPHKTWNHSSRNGWCLKAPADALALPPVLIRRARAALLSSPLQAVYASHLKRLTTSAATLAEDPAAPDLGAATIALSRALISSAAGDGVHAREALHESLVPRIQVFVREHLRDPDLTPETIASAHHISVRLLYRVMAEAGLQLEQWVIDQRLEGARSDLASAVGRHKSIAAIAHQWAFATPSHFSRRFRTKYGLTPREWQRTQA
ncbi:helix-turn-helix domain-containing protein [Nocardioides sp. CER19]|uniref:helix-turn-helix domain-containing protein n=1 Tax=Nocardioides sp. CER19 TaxID=3038538 RepID=UPI002449F41E|nr:helix-turn-helix domain-containing protein [Nocardioides sp. CER19]MDH2413906.1 helix-turn-helix domain-containing protein [Nocardioides sp. CER19]